MAYRFNDLLPAQRVTEAMLRGTRHTDYLKAFAPGWTGCPIAVPAELWLVRDGTRRYRPCMDTRLRPNGLCVSHQPIPDDVAEQREAAQAGTRLTMAGIRTVAAFRRLSDADLLRVDGIGPKYAGLLRIARDTWDDATVEDRFHFVPASWLVDGACNWVGEGVPA